MVPSVYTVLQTTGTQKPFSAGTWKTYAEAAAGKLDVMENFKSRFASWRMWDKDTVAVYFGTSGGPCDVIEKTRFDIVEIPLPE